MKYLIFSDLHANLIALQKILAYAEAAQISQIIHLGDIVGYNGFPSECIELFREHNIRSIRGNHDEMLTGKLSLSTCNSDIAPHTLKISRRIMSKANYEYLEKLPAQIDINASAVATHAGFYSTLTTINTIEKAKREFGALINQQKRVAFFGHTHRAMLFEYEPEGNVCERPLSLGSAKIEPDKYYLINPGSAGQSRHNLPLSFIVFDDELNVLQLHHLTLSSEEQDFLEKKNRNAFGKLRLVKIRRRAIRFGQRVWKKSLSIF